MTGVYHHIQPLVEIPSANFLPVMALNHDPPGLCLPSSLDYKHEQLCLSRSWHSYKVNRKKDETNKKMKSGRAKTYFFNKYTTISTFLL
jgi:hypothetical protein